MTGIAERVEGSRASSGRGNITDPRPSLDHHQPGPFANLVVAQLLTGAEADDDRPRPVDGLEDCRQSCPLRRLKSPLRPRSARRGL
jgi:hypothetical protein